MVILAPVATVVAALILGLTSAHQLDPTSLHKEFAELFTSQDGTQTYDVTANTDSSEELLENMIPYSEPKRKVPVKPSEFFHLKRPDFISNRTHTDIGVAVISPDEPYYVIELEKLGSRQKRDSEPSWQSAWRERHVKYQKANGQRSETSTVETTERTTTHAQISRNKFARQFVSSDQDDRLGGLRGFSDPNDENNLIDSTPRETTQRRPKTKKRTTTTTTTTTTTEEPADTDSDSPSSQDSDIGSMVANIIEDLEVKNIAKVELPPPILIKPLWMEPEPQDLDPRKSQKLRDMIVQKHNHLRSLVTPLAGNMLKMEWNDDAQRIAQRWAEVCKFEHDNGEQRRTSQFKCGQNLARGWPKPLSWNLTMQLWFDERKDFNFDGLPRGMVGHYTQLVWAQSYQIGCAYKDCGKFHYYVCDYCPTGNLESKKYKPYQKSRESCESCPGECENGKLCTNPCPFTDKYSNCAALEAEFQVCTDISYGLLDSCQATCKCKGKIH